VHIIVITLIFSAILFRQAAYSFRTGSSNWFFTAVPQTLQPHRAQRIRLTIFYALVGLFLAGFVIDALVKSENLRTHILSVLPGFLMISSIAAVGVWTLLNPLGMFRWVQHSHTQLEPTPKNLLICRIVGCGLLFIGIYSLSKV